MRGLEEVIAIKEKDIEIERRQKQRVEKRMAELEVKVVELERERREGDERRRADQLRNRVDREEVQMRLVEVERQRQAEAREWEKRLSDAVRQNAELRERVGRLDRQRQEAEKGVGELVEKLNQANRENRRLESSGGQSETVREGLERQLREQAEAGEKQKKYIEELARALEEETVRRERAEREREMAKADMGRLEDWFKEEQERRQMAEARERREREDRERERGEWERDRRQRDERERREKEEREERDRRDKEERDRRDREERDRRDREEQEKRHREEKERLERQERERLDRREKEGRQREDKRNQTWAEEVKIGENTGREDLKFENRLQLTSLGHIKAEEKKRDGDSQGNALRANTNSLLPQLSKVIVNNEVVFEKKLTPAHFSGSKSNIGANQSLSSLRRFNFATKRKISLSNLQKPIKKLKHSLPQRSGREDSQNSYFRLNQTQGSLSNRLGVSRSPVRRIRLEDRRVSTSQKPAPLRRVLTRTGTSADHKAQRAGRLFEADSRVDSSRIVAGVKRVVQQSVRRGGKSESQESGRRTESQDYYVDGGPKRGGANRVGKVGDLLAQIKSNIEADKYERDDPDSGRYEISDMSMYGQSFIQNGGKSPLAEVYNLEFYPTGGSYRFTQKKPQTRLQFGGRGESALNIQTKKRLPVGTSRRESEKESEPESDGETETGFNVEEEAEEEGFDELERRAQHKAWERPGKKWVKSSSKGLVRGHLVKK